MKRNYTLKLEPETIDLIGHIADERGIPHRRAARDLIIFAIKARGQAVPKSDYLELSMTDVEDLLRSMTRRIDRLEGWING